MALILSSCDFRNANSRRTILENLKKPIGQCSLIYLPNERATLEAIHGDKYRLRMQSFGFGERNIRIFDPANAESFVGLDIDVIYVSGGNTFEMLKRMRECGFDREIIRYVKSGVTYIGGSAGAHIASRSIEHLADLDPIPEGMRDFDGLGLFDGILVCHYTEARKELYERLKSEGKRVYALTDDDSLVIEANGEGGGAVR